jgi:dihydrofolate reductase
MSKAVLFMSMSLDGYIAGPNETVANGLGDGGAWLHEWFFATDAGAGAAGANRQIVDELMATGAVVAGKGTVEPAGYWDGDHHDGVPIFILSCSAPPRHVAEMPLVTFVDDVTEAIKAAKRAADEKDVLVHGAGVARLALAAGVLDELEITVVPVLLGSGRPLFDHLAAEQIELERTRVIAGESGVTHLHYRCRR